MSRIAARFQKLKGEGRRALIPFITAGDPSPDLTVPLMHTLVEAGADILELGVPFSDPMADGPVIQQAHERALLRGMTLAKVLDLVREFRTRNTDTPVVLMGYLNPIEAMGYQEFAARAAKVGVDGVLTVDLPPEEAQDWCNEASAHGLDPVFLLAPTSDARRIELIVNAARGFVYYVALRGVTGAKNLDLTEVEQKIEDIRRHTTLPVGVGFGISGPESAGQVATFADAVIVGSALVRRVAEFAGEPQRLTEEIKGFVYGLRRAIDAATQRAGGSA